jgi:hypothetical protein
VDPEAAIVVTVEGLRDFVRAFLSSPVARKLQQLPTVQAWLASDKYKELERSRATIEAFIGTNLTELRDELLGDAVVLALRLPADCRIDASEPRGLLLFQARDQALLERVIRVVNTTQQNSGELARLGDRVHGGATYHVREFPAGSERSAEWYVTYPDGTCAFSNSEALIQAVIDRKSHVPHAQRGQGTGSRVAPTSGHPSKSACCLGDLPRLKSVQNCLPAHALARLYLDPRQVERLLAAAPRSNTPDEAKLPDMILRYLAAVDYAGAALVLTESAVVIHTVEALEPSRLDPWIRRWSGDARRFDRTLSRVPPTAVALAGAHLDASALYDALRLVVPEPDQAGLDNLETVLKGLLLGQDLRTCVLPHLGPGVVAYLDSPPAAEKAALVRAPKDGGSWLLPLVAVIGLEEGAGAAAPLAGRSETATAAISLADALENALRTLLALAAMDKSRNQGRSRITTRSVAGAAVSTLDPPIPFAYAVDRLRGRCILSNSADSVARYLESCSDSNAGDRFGRLKPASFAKTSTFCCVDLQALSKLAHAHLDHLVESLAARQKRPVVEVRRDLTHAFALSRLFEGAFITSQLETGAALVQRSLGLILREQNAASREAP